MNLLRNELLSAANGDVALPLTVFFSLLVPGMHAEEHEDLQNSSQNENLAKARKECSTRRCCMYATTNETITTTHGPLDCQPRTSKGQSHERTLRGM